MQAQTDKNPAHCVSPDVSRLKDEQVLREIDMVRQIIETRIDAMDKAIKILEAYPTSVDRAIAQLKELHERRFDSVTQQLAERDIRFNERAVNNKTSIETALQAAKELVNAQQSSSALATTKNEAYTVKQIDQIEALMNANISATNGKIEDIKTRITTFEGRSIGMGASWGYLIAAVSLLGTLVAIGIALFRNGNP